MIDKDFVRGDVTDLTDIAEAKQFSTSLTCSCVLFMSMRFEIIEPITITSKGLRVVGIFSDKDRDQKFILNIYKHEMIKVTAHFASNEQGQPLVTLFLLRNCAQYVKMQLQLTDDQQQEQQQQQSEQTEFKSHNSVHARRLILLFDGCISLSDREMIKSMFDCVSEMSSLDAAQIIKGIAESDRSRQLRQNEQINLLMYPSKGTGSLCIRMEDYMCLTKKAYLNDIIIDFYLLWLWNTQLTEQQRKRTHIFSIFFYNRLTTPTTPTTPTDMKQTAAQKRHARVERWTKVVDIFDKDFIIVPINEQSHWFLAIICFPCLKGPVNYDTNQPVEPHLGIGGDEIPAVRQPLILIFDSLAGVTRSSRSHVVDTLRDYLTCEYRVKKTDAQAHIFNKDNMPGHCVEVPQQQNLTDCGLYLLQYVEQFFSQPITDYRLPIKQLTNWFDFLTVTKKREDIAQLIQKLMDDANKQQEQRLILPLIEFPTLNGQLVEYSDDTKSADRSGRSRELEADEEPSSKVHDDNLKAMDVDTTPVLEEAVMPKTGNNSTITTTTSTTTGRRLRLKRRLQNDAAAAAVIASPTTTTTTGGPVPIISSNGNTSKSQTSQQQQQPEQQPKQSRWGKWSCLIH